MSSGAESASAVVTRAGRYWRDDRGIIRGCIHPRTEMTLEHAKEDVAACLQLARGEKRQVLIDLRGIKSQTRECRAYFQGDEASRLTRACALIVGSPVSRVVGNFFLGLNAPAFPMKLFSAEDEALAWLESLPP
jgi:hypothetical protein